MLHVTIDLYVLMIAIAVGFVKGAHRKQGYIKSLPFFLFLILCVEFSGMIMQAYIINNSMLYNIFTIVQITYYAYIFREATPDLNKRIVTQLMWIYPVICLVNIFFIQGTHMFHTYSFTIGCVLMIALGVVYFYRLFKSSEHVVLLREPAFWISISIVFFFICALAFFSIANYISELPFSFRYNLRRILKLVNGFAYIFFIIAFLCRSKNIPKSSSL